MIGDPMHPDLHPVAEFFGHVLHHFTQCRAPSAPSSPFDGVPNQLTQLLKGQVLMSDVITKLDAKITELTTTVNNKLTAAQTARDQAVADLATTNATLADVQAKLAAMPSDTADLEAQIQAETDKVSGVIDKLNGIDATPVSAPAPSEPTDATPPADTTAEPTPVQVAPADINPAMPPA